MGKITFKWNTSWTYRVFAVTILVFAVLVFAVWQPVSVEYLLDWGSAKSSHPATALGLVALQALLLTLALPGTLMLWLVAPLYHPLPAALILTAGSVLGALGAYGVSRHVRGDRSARGRNGRVITLLQKRGDLFMQLTLRVIPGFPHSVINYGAGVLGLPLGSFIAAAALGMSVKWFMYASAIQAMLEMGAEPEQIGMASLTPLFFLAIFLVVGWLVHQKIKAGRMGSSEHEDE